MSSMGLAYVHTSSHAHARGVDGPETAGGNGVK